MHLRSGLTLVSLSVLASSICAQDIAVVSAVPSESIGTEPVDGTIPGTKRYNVTFRERGFTLDEFRSAVENQADADVVERIVRDLELRARHELEGFREEIEDRRGRIERYFWLINACTIEVAPDQVEAVRALRNVLYVDPDLPTQPLIRTSTNASNHNSDAVQTAGNRGTGFALAIVDTGQDSNMGGTGRPHRTYYRNGSIAITNAGGLGGSLLLANLQIGTQPADDTNGHGTGVCSISAGSIWGSATADNGHANDAFKVGYSICNSAGSCGSSLATEAAGWQQAAADKVKFNIVAGNMSYGSTRNPTDVSQQAIDACALNANLLPVTAAGNSGSSNTGSASCVNGLSVAATSANTKAVASFSSRGPMPLVGTFPAIAANGVNTVMAGRDNDNGNYTGSGTSMAAPQVCGVAGLVKYARPTASAREIKAVLLASSENVASYTENTGGQGYLRADRAVATAAAPDAVITDSISSTSTPNFHLLNVTSGQTVKIALTWYRHNLASTSWSDLGLTVKNGAAVVATKDSPLNVYEVVTFVAPVTGTLIVEVNATTLTIAAQPYSIAVNATSGTMPAFTNGTSGSYTITGAGCVGTGGLVTAGGIPSMHPSGNPRIGQNLTVSLSYAKTSSVGILFFGLASLNIDLGPAGAPGCVFRSGVAVMDVAATTATGSGSVVYSIPNDSSLVGGTFHNQYLVLDAAANTLGFVVSNSARGTIGTR